MLHCVPKGLLYAFDMTLGKRIQMARERIVPPMTQADLGKKFGISDKAVSAWERDDTHPRPEKYPKLARELQVPLIWLHEGKGPPPPPDDVAVILEALPEAERAAYSAVARAMLAQRKGAA